MDRDTMCDYIYSMISSQYYTINKISNILNISSKEADILINGRGLYKTNYCKLLGYYAAISNHDRGRRNVINRNNKQSTNSNNNIFNTGLRAV